MTPFLGQHWCGAGRHGLKPAFPARVYPRAHATDGSSTIFARAGYSGHQTSLKRKDINRRGTGDSQVMGIWPLSVLSPLGLGHLPSQPPLGHLSPPIRVLYSPLLEASLGNPTPFRSQLSPQPSSVQVQTLY